MSIIFRRPSLAPRDPVKGARTEEWISLVNTHIDPLLVRQYLRAHFFPGTPDGAPTARRSTPHCRKWSSILQCSIGLSPKPATSVGDTFTLADINLLPILYYMSKTPESGAMLRRYASLRSYFDRHMSRPSAMEATPPPFPGRQG